MTDTIGWKGCPGYSPIHPESPKARGNTEIWAMYMVGGGVGLRFVIISYPLPLFHFYHTIEQFGINMFTILEGTLVMLDAVLYVQRN